MEECVDSSSACQGEDGGVAASGADGEDMNVESAEAVDDEDEEDDDEGWITPENLSAARKAMCNGDMEDVSSEISVACMTTDFAMQVGPIDLCL